MQSESLAARVGLADNAGMAQETTLKIVLEHIHDMRMSMEKRFDRLEADVGMLKHDVLSLKQDVFNLQVKVEKNRMMLSTQIDNLDQRLDDLEIPFVEQKHEERIQRLERHAGFRPRKAAAR
jgi:predicted nuclease with TOPRIM domain